MKKPAFPTVTTTFAGRGVHPGNGPVVDDLDDYAELLTIRSAARGPRKGDRVLGCS